MGGRKEGRGGRGRYLGLRKVIQSSINARLEEVNLRQDHLIVQPPQFLEERVDELRGLGGRPPCPHVFIRPLPIISKEQLQYSK